MKVGLQLPSFSYPGGTAAIGPSLGAIAATAEEAGFASLWVMDHFFQVPEETGWGGPEAPRLEAYTTLGFIAHATKRIRLGAMVGGVHFRAPAVVLKAATTLDILSGGRGYLGIGAGWYRREATGLGLPFPDLSERFKRLDELLRLAQHLWSGDRQPFEGRFTTMAEPILSPLPLSRPHPPIMIGGGGERTTLRLVARYGDACNILVPDPGESRAKLDVLRRHCQEVGRDYDEIERRPWWRSTFGPAGCDPGTSSSGYATRRPRASSRSSSTCPTCTSRATCVRSARSSSLRWRSSARAKGQGLVRTNAGCRCPARRARSAPAAPRH